MNKKDKLFVVFGVFGIIAGIIGTGYKPEFLTKFNRKDLKILPMIAILSGLASLFFVADEMFLPEDEEEVVEV